MTIKPNEPNQPNPMDEPNDGARGPLDPRVPADQRSPMDPRVPAPEATEPPRDELDSLLRDWHDESAVIARARRDELLARATRKSGGPSEVTGDVGADAARWRIGTAPDTALDATHARWRRLHRFVSAPALRAAALVAVGVITVTMLMILPSRRASACDTIVQVPEGGRLDAVDSDGQLVGPCPLEHTDVNAEISGFISRVTVAQKYRNTYGKKIEAIYTFPLSHRAAVDRMRMIVRHLGEERIVEGEVKERSLARQIYESARRDGFVASLLEQERPNIFTQSVANIEPGAEVLVEISYVETLAMRDGEFTFDFPMVVGPRYIPGASSPATEGRLREGLVARRGVILLAPAQIRIDATEPEMIRSAAAVMNAIQFALPIMPPSQAWIESKAPESGTVTAIFTARYPDGSEEPGTLRADRTGEVAGRWFWFPPRLDGDRPLREGTGFAEGTDQVPDAGRITPMPVRPPERAGHDLSMRVTIDTGGPAVTNIRSDLHRVDVREPAASRTVVTLERGTTIPNRDFVLSWKLAGGALAEGVLTQHIPGRDGYFLLYMVPPARVEPATIRPRELVFVLDTSGSMSGFPIEKSKEVMTRMLGAMRAADTFNIITFAGDHHVLWPAPRPATEENLKLARVFVESRKGGGGTEMMKAIDAALRQTTLEAARDRGESASVPPTRIVSFLTDGYVGNDLAIVDAIRRHSGTTRVFSFGIGNSVNRYLLAEMARAGRGAADFVLLPSDADEVVDRFSERVQTPVLTDISLSFEGVETAHVTPPADALPDLFDREPLVIAGRYAAPGRGSIRIRGMTAQGPWERIIDVDFPEAEGNSSVVAPIWARLQVDDILRPHLNQLQKNAVAAPVRAMVVRLAEEHRIMSPFTSFVAVEKTRMTLGGQSVLVAVPIELPQGVSWEGNFGSAGEVLRRLAPNEAQQLAFDVRDGASRSDRSGAPPTGGVYAMAPADPTSSVASGPVDALGVTGSKPARGPAPATKSVDAEGRSNEFGAVERSRMLTDRDAQGGGGGGSGAPSTGAAPAPAASPSPAPSAAPSPAPAPAPATAPAPAPTPAPRPASAPAPAAAPGAPPAGGRTLTDPRPTGAPPVVVGRVTGGGASAPGLRLSVPRNAGGIAGGAATPASPAQAQPAPVEAASKGPARTPPLEKRAEGGESLNRELAPGGRREEPKAGIDKDAAAANEPAAEALHETNAATNALFTAEQLNRLSARMEDSLVVLGFRALAAIEVADQLRQHADRAPAGGGSESASAAAPAAPSSSAAPTPSAPVRVVARFTKFDAALESALKAMGIEIEARAPRQSMLILRVPQDRLVRLGLMEQTVRVEPMEPPKPALER